MEEDKKAEFTKLEFEISLADQFWFERTRRYIRDCDSIDTVKDMATLLAKIATQRHSIIKGLVKDLAHFNTILEKSESKR